VRTYDAKRVRNRFYVAHTVQGFPRCKFFGKAVTLEITHTVVEVPLDLTDDSTAGNPTARQRVSERPQILGSRVWANGAPLSGLA
jgi:hypothetical protein